MSLAEPIPPQTAPTLVLASGSPRRRALLAMAGFAFEVAAPAVDESPFDGERPAEMVVRLARAKAAAVAERHRPDTHVLACDTTVVLEGVSLGKPESEADAVAMLLRLGGRTHEVVTGYALQPAWSEDPVSGTVSSLVTMHDVTRAAAAAYVATGEPLDKAGSYALQGEGSRFVAEVAGSRSNVIGLPLETIVPLLRRHGVTGRGA